MNFKHLVCMSPILKYSIMICASKTEPKLNGIGRLPECNKGYINKMSETIQSVMVE